MENTKVAVVGLLPLQANKIQSAYDDRLDLRFIEVDGASVPRVLATASSSDYVILMTKFIPHDLQILLRKHDGLVFCNGGMSAVKGCLDEILQPTKQHQF